MTEKDILKSLVLVLDDVSVVRLAIKSMLISIGFEEKNIYTSHSSKAGVNIVKKRSIDIILSDYNFGHDINGRQLFEELVHYNLLKPEMVFIMVTGEANRNIVDSMLTLNPDDYILKPFNQLTLKQRMFLAVEKKVPI